MDRAQAHRLWLSTLSLGLVGADDATRRRLEAVWRQAGLDDADTGPLRDALSVADDLQRRTRIVRETRAAIRRAGFDPDLLSTPAANMQGL